MLQQILLWFDQNRPLVAMLVVYGMAALGALWLEKNHTDWLDKHYGRK